MDLLGLPYELLSIDILGRLKLYELNNFTKTDYFTEDVAKYLYLNKYQHFNKYLLSSLSYKDKILTILYAYNRYIESIKNNFLNPEINKVIFNDTFGLELGIQMTFSGDLGDFNIEYSFWTNSPELEQDLQDITKIVFNSDGNIDEKDIIMFFTNLFTNFLTVTDNKYTFNKIDISNYFTKPTIRAAGSNIRVLRF